MPIERGLNIGDKISRIERLERLSITFTSNGKREFVPHDQVFPITRRLLIIISRHKLVVSRNFLSIRAVLSCFLSAHSLFYEILNLNLTFAVCRIREA